MASLERQLINLLLQVFTVDQINQFLSDPRNVAIFVGMLISISGALLGTFLLLRGLSLTSDAISHTVLLGIVVAFLVMTGLFNMEPDLSSIWLLIGATGAGVATVVLTEAIFRSGLVKEDAALGLAFPFLFAIAIILVSRYADKVHLDADSVLVGEIGIAWANTNSHCYEHCESITITPDDPRAEVGRVCINCTDGINPRDSRAIFEETCSNCGTYTAAEAWRERLIPEQPKLVFFPKAITVMSLITLLNVLFVLVFYKELKLATFDSALAATLGFRPAALHYALMILVSLTAVGAFDAVGAVLVVAFFIIPPATAFLITSRLSRMILLSPLFGVLGAVTGYELARDNVLWLFHVSDILKAMDSTIGLNGYTAWNSSISASMVLMLFFWFGTVWIFSPRNGLVSTLLKRSVQRQNFAMQMLLGHLYHHQQTPEAADECSPETLHEHLNWSSRKAVQILTQARVLGLVEVAQNQLHLTERGEKQVVDFREHYLVSS